MKKGFTPSLDGTFGYDGILAYLYISSFVSNVRPMSLPSLGFIASIILARIVIRELCLTTQLCSLTKD